MEKEKIFELLNSTLWQDYKGFAREEKENSDDCFSTFGGIMILVIMTSVIGGIFAVVVECPQVMLAIPTVLVFILIPYFKKNWHRWRIEKNAYDIEATVNDIKIIRNKRGKMGLCQWKKYTYCRLLCKSKYDSIKRTYNDTFIMERNGKYGLYSGFMKNIIAECRYDKIESLSDEVFALYYEGGMSKMNYKGDRILL